MGQKVQEAACHMDLVACHKVQAEHHTDHVVGGQMGPAVHHKDQEEAHRKVLADDRMVPVAARHTDQEVVLRKDPAAVRRSALAAVHRRGREAARRGCNGVEVARAHRDRLDHTARVLLARLRGHRRELAHLGHRAAAVGRQRLPVQAQVQEPAQQAVLLLVQELRLLMAPAPAAVMPVPLAAAVEAGTPAAAAVDRPSAVPAAPALAAPRAAALAAAAPAPAAVEAAAAVGAVPGAAAAVAVDHSASAHRPQQQAWSKWTPASPHCSSRRPGRTGRPARVGTSLGSAALTSRALAPHPNCK
mmetsp:Transcript_52733/g.98971  ORF Transcript_52733/g.98971 Transcript_52733/m.98971 type:complete len:302 (+) Transcript_52733:309-1214(+)